MKTLGDLVNSTQGRHYLRSRHIFTSKADFVGRLTLPLNPSLGTYLDQDNRHLVWAGQQVYADCTRSMLERMTTLLTLDAHADVSSFFLWVDSDRAGSDELAMRFFWPLRDKKVSIRICHKRRRSDEARFTELDADRLQRAFDSLGQVYPLSVEQEEELLPARERYERLRPLFLEGLPVTLAEFNYRLSQFLLQETHLQPRPVLLSTLLNRELLTPEVERVINRLDEIIHVFNETLTGLLNEEIDPLVRPLPDDYLPLNYACPVDNRRLRLRRTVRGEDQYAVATCQCDNTYRFYLGKQALSISSLEETGRWSPDILLPLFLNNLVSGYVGGKSSVIYYGLVMAPVSEKVFGAPRLPILVPPGTASNHDVRDLPNSLLHAYITGELA